MTREEKPHTEPANGAKLFRHIAKSFWIFPQYLLNIHVYSDNYALAPVLYILFPIKKPKVLISLAYEFHELFCFVFFFSFDGS